MSRVISFFRMLAIVVVAATLLRPSAALLEDLVPPLPSMAPPAYAPCLMICVNDYIKNLDLTVVFDPTKPICCPEWKELIENDPKCYCDNIGSALTTNATEIDNSLKKCDINASADTVCKDVGAPSKSSSTKWTGPISGLMLLMAGLLLIF